MKVNSECIGCRDCLPYCPQRAISMNPEDRAEIDRYRCVECGLCFDTDICPVSAFEEDHDELAELKKRFGRLLSGFPGGKKAGRGGGFGFDVKTNDVTKKIPSGKVSMRFELGRPVGGIKLGEVVALQERLIDSGWSPNMGARYQSLFDAGFPQDILEHHILSSIFEFILKPEDIPILVGEAKRNAMDEGLWMTVNVVGLAETIDHLLTILKSSGIETEPAAKVNLGLGRRM